MDWFNQKMSPWVLNISNPHEELKHVKVLLKLLNVFSGPKHLNFHDGYAPTYCECAGIQCCDVNGIL